MEHNTPTIVFNFQNPQGPVSFGSTHNWTVFKNPVGLLVDDYGG